MGLGTGAGTLALSQTELNNITAATLVFGSASSTGAMTVGGTVTLPSSITNLSLISGSSIAVASGGSLSDFERVQQRSAAGRKPDAGRTGVGQWRQ